MGRKQQIRLARHRAGRHVDHHRNRLTICLGMVKRGERVGGLAALRNEQCQSACLEHRIAVTKLARHIDVNWHSSKTFEPIFGDHPGIIGCSAGDDRDPLDLAQIKLEIGQRDGALERPDIAL